MTCRICSNARDNTRHVAREMMFGYRTAFTYFQCAECGCLQIAEIPADLGDYYPVDYYSYQPNRRPGAVNTLKQAVRNLRTRYAVTGRGLLGRLAYAFFPAPHVRLLSRLRLKKNAAILDAGCGSGSLLYDLREAGFTNLLGADPFNKNDIHYPNGLSILKKTVHEVPGKWDLVMFHHSFEHVTDPAETLQAVSRILPENGVCLIRVPVASSFAWEHYGTNWVQLDAPRHLFLHTPKSMAILAERCGLAVTDTVYDSCEFQFWGSEQYRQDIPLTHERSYARNPDKSLFTPRQIREFRKKSRELNARGQGDSAAFFLRKKSG